jgi:Arc/MetJ-type ribon-helix-helix transcriptional regulator
MEEFIIPLISFRLPEQMLNEMDDIRDSGAYPSRAELIRTAIQALLNDEKSAAKWGNRAAPIIEQTSQ